MQFQHTTPFPSGMLANIVGLSTDIGVPQHATATGASGDSILIIPPNDTDTFSIELLQLIIAWGDVTTPGKFEIRSVDDTLTLYEDGASGTLIIPCFNEIELLGQYGLRAVNNSTGGEYSITAHYKVKEP